MKQEIEIAQKNMKRLRILSVKTLIASALLRYQSFKAKEQCEQFKKEVEQNRKTK